jgi:predicted O-linked N-acetylglucosamine transferase (SPINDLY family)
MNFTGTSIFTQLLSGKYKIAGFNDLSPNERPEIQKISTDLLKRAEKLAAVSDYAKVSEILLKVYKMLRNNTGKAVILEQLIKAYAELRETEKMTEAARALMLSATNALNSSAEAVSTCALAYAAAKEDKNAIFLREKIFETDKTNAFNNLKLFELYLNEKMFYKAEEINREIKSEPDSESELLRFSFFYRTFREKEAIFYMRESAKFARQSNNRARLADNLLLSITGSLYYGFLNDDEYVQMINEHYNEKMPSKENTFDGYKPKQNAIKLGFVSGAVSNHPVGYFISSLFKEKNTGGNFEYFFYDGSEPYTDMYISNLIKENSNHYTDIHKFKSDDLERAILDDKLDILIDLNGLSDKGIWNILVNRLAPVQMTWIGFPCTLPVKNIDYNIADKITDPIGIAEKFYTEKLLYLPKTFLCYGITEAKDITEAPFIKNGYVTFGSFNNGNKYSDAILKIWAAVLNSVKNARLVIRTKDIGNEYTKTQLTEKFAKNGVDITRTEFLPETSRIDYFVQYNTIDIILDTYPFNGATTTCDAFLMGTPIISLYGDTHVSRVGLSMLTTVGYPELAVKTADEYVKLAAKLCGDFELLKEITSSIRGKALASPLFNSAVFKPDFEDAVYTAYQNHFAKNG